MKRFFTVITAGRFWLNILLIGVFLIILVSISLFLLKLYTQHGESTTVPDLTNYRVDQISNILGNKELHFEISDSIYSDELPRGVVVSQNPDPNTQVKRGRTLFLTVNSTLPELVLVPDLVGKSRRIALPLLEIVGLKLDKLIYEPDPSCTDCVLGLQYEGGRINAGDPLRKGEKITIVLGEQSNQTTAVPRLLGLTYKEAVEIITAQSLNMGQILSCKGCETAVDTTHAFVANQMPEHGAEIRLGSYIDLYLTTDSTVFITFEAETDTTYNEDN